MVSRFTTSRRLRKAPVFLHFLCAKQKTSEITSEMARLRIHDSTRTRPSLRYPGLREVSIHPGKWPCKRLCNGAVQSISWSVSPEVSCYQQLLHVCLGDPSRTVAVGCQTTGACGCHDLAEQDQGNRCCLPVAQAPRKSGLFDREGYENRNESNLWIESHTFSIFPYPQPFPHLLRVVFWFSAVLDPRWVA